MIVLMAAQSATCAWCTPNAAESRLAHMITQQPVLDSLIEPPHGPEALLMAVVAVTAARPEWGTRWTMSRGADAAPVLVGLSLGWSELCHVGLY